MHISSSMGNFFDKNDNAVSSSNPISGGQVKPSIRPATVEISKAAPEQKPEQFKPDQAKNDFGKSNDEVSADKGGTLIAIA